MQKRRSTDTAHCGRRIGLTASLVLVLALAAGIALHETASAASGPTASAGGRPEIYFVPDVVGQFNALALRPDGLAFGIGDSPDPSLCKHYQGVARAHGPGTPYLFVTRSGNDAGAPCVSGDDPAGLLVVRMGSRDTNGERLRTNRLIRDWAPYFTDPAGPQIQWTKPPDPRDAAARYIIFDGSDGWPDYGHAGGTQLVGDVLAVPLEKRYSSAYPENMILFIDVSNPEAPVRLSHLAPEPGGGYSAGVVGLTPVRNPAGPGVRYLLITTGSLNLEVRLYRSLPNKDDGSTDLKAPDVGWELLRTLTEDPVCIETPLGRQCAPVSPLGPAGVDSHQSLNFLREGSIDGPLFLLGARNTFLGGSGDDLLDLWRVNVDAYGNPADPALSHVRTKHMTSYPFNGHGDSAAFSTAAGAYVSPSGELIFYSTEYENDGPFELKSDGQPGRRTVRFGEWRHREVVRPDSPTLRPSVELAGPFEVDEGSALTLTGAGKAPITKAWIQLFEDDGAGSSLPGLGDDDAWLAVDYDDWGKDNFDDFSLFDYGTGTEFNDNAGSWRWFAPKGCTIRANEDRFGATTGVFPGRHTKTLAGRGTVVEDSDLNAVANDGGDASMDDVISSVQFDGIPGSAGCAVYYNAPIGVEWDLDADGLFETAGGDPRFSAAQRDGPDLQTVYARGRHPFDASPLGLGAPVAASVRVRNVPPRVAGFAISGPGPGVDLPFTLVHVENVVAAAFTDPGRPDRQSAALDFGDGTVVPSGSFDSFGDAFGGATGRLRQRHTYAARGAYTVRLEVADDDGGRTAEAISVQVVSPAEALQLLTGRIDQLISGAGNPNVAAALSDARNNLAGNPKGNPRNGAIQELANGDLVAALVKIGAAIKYIESAEASGGGDLGLLKYLLGQTAESVAQAAYLEAAAAVGSPGPGQSLQLQRIGQSITDGHARLVAGEYAAAIDKFKDAAGRALQLL